MRKILLPILMLFLAACSGARAVPITGSTVAPKNGAGSSSTASVDGVRACDYVPGVSKPVQVKPETLVSVPTPTLSPHDLINSAVDADTTTKQLNLYRKIWTTVKDNYVYLDLNGRDWQAVGNQYEMLIRNGMKQEDFYQAMQQMINDLDGGMSRYYSPSQWAEQTSASNGTSQYVGIGGAFTRIDRPDPVIVLIGVLPGSPAEKAGLKSHDVILQVDGKSPYDMYGNPATLGPEGSLLTLTVQTPGQPPREVQLTRARVSGRLPFDFCLVPKTRIAYLHRFDFSDPDLLAQVTSALDKLAAGGPLQGLVLDTRDPYGQTGEIGRVNSVLSFFTKGELGSFVSRSGKDPFTVNAPVDLHGSQSVPLLVLQDRGSGQIEQLLGGVLQLKGRAQIVGQPLTEPMYNMQPFHFSDGSVLGLATATFQPVGKSLGYFNKNGVLPDVNVPSRWDLFTEATDPVLAKAVEVLSQPQK